MRCGMLMLRIYPSNTFWNIRYIYFVARSAKYVRVLRWTQVWPLSNLILLNTSGIRAAAQRIKTAKDSSGVIQERDLCYAQISSLSSCTRMYNCLTVYFKRLTERFYDMPLLKIVNASERTRMSVYNCSTGYFQKRWRQAKGLWKVFSKP